MKFFEPEEAYEIKIEPEEAYGLNLSQEGHMGLDFEPKEAHTLVTIDCGARLLYLCSASVLSVGT